MGLYQGLGMDGFVGILWALFHCLQAFLTGVYLEKTLFIFTFSF